MSLDDLFCDVDDFCRLFLPDWHRQQLPYGERQRVRGCRLALSEIMTILIHFHPSHYRDFKAYYWLHVCRHLASDFPNRLSYNRFVAVIPTVLMPLCVYLHTRKGQATGIAFIMAFFGYDRNGVFDQSRDRARLTKPVGISHAGRQGPAGR